MPYVGSVTSTPVQKMLSVQVKPLPAMPVLAMPVLAMPVKVTPVRASSVAITSRSTHAFPTSALLTHALPPQAQDWTASLIQLDFSELQTFEVVRDQYQQWGLEFEQTIALQPSNPAFDNLKQSVGLMPGAHPFMAIQFHQPRQVVKANLVGAKTITVTAFDASHQVLVKSCLECHVASSSDPLEPEQLIHHHALHLQADAIARVEITSTAPFMLHDFCCI